MTNKIAKAKMSFPLEYKVDLPLENGADLSIINFSHEEHSWIFSYRCRENLGSEERINDYTCSVRYKDGIASELSIMMVVVFPQRRGQQFVYGVDVSKNSKMTITFDYVKVEGLDLEGKSITKFQLAEVIVGCAKRLRFSELKAEEGILVPTVYFPYEVKDVVNLDCGYFEIPFKLCSILEMESDADHRTEHFRFPNSIIKPLRMI